MRNEILAFIGVLIGLIPYTAVRMVLSLPEWERPLFFQDSGAPLFWLAVFIVPVGALSLAVWSFLYLSWVGLGTLAVAAGVAWGIVTRALVRLSFVGYLMWFPALGTLFGSVLFLSYMLVLWFGIKP